MMQVPVRSLLGLAGVPSHRTSASRWLAKAGVVISAIYDSVEGAREAAKNRKAARVAEEQARAANGFLADSEFAAALADLSAPEVEQPQPEPAKVVGARFGTPLQPKRKTRAVAETDDRAAITAEMLENFDRKRGLDWSRYGG